MEKPALRQKHGFTYLAVYEWDWDFRTCGAYCRKESMAKPVETNSALDAINDASIEASIEAKAIGEKIRQLRLKRSMGLVELGQRTGLSPSFLSQLETGRVTPTLRNLARISMVFKKDMSYFFRVADANSFRISRAKNRIRLPIGEKKTPFLISESMSALIPDRSVVPCIAEFLPGIEDAAFHPQIFPGLEFAYVINGSVLLSNETEKQILEPGDVAWVEGTANRQYRRHGETAAKALIVTFPKNS